MLYNYLKVGIRNILKYKVFSFINVFGLAVAMSVCLLIILMLADKKSHDQFHVKKDSIYRILAEPKNARQAYATTPFPLAGTLKTDYPIIDESTHLVSGIGGDATYNQQTAEMRGFFADTSFFKVFSYELEKGNKNLALANPNSMVITSKVAELLFKDENPLGKTVQFVDRGLHYLESGSDTPPVPWGNFTITGVIADKDYKSHLKFDVLVSSASMQALHQSEKIINLTNNWTDHNRTWTYVVLDSDKNSQDLTVALNQLAASKYNDMEGFKGFKLMAQPLTQINTDLLNNEISYRLPLLVYYFLSVLALVIMLSACLNYTNLSIARALTRAKEIGVRKVNGAQRKDLVLQFLSESVITALLALAMSLLLLIFIKPAFKSLWINQFLDFKLETDYWVYFIFAGFALLIGLIAGAYPALYLSKYQPVKVLKNLDSMRPGKLGMRKVLTTFQFVLSLFFITTSILIYNQFKHFIEFDYRFNTENIINIELQSNDFKLLSKEMSSVPGVSTISACDIIPATGRSNVIQLKKIGSEKEARQLTFLQVNENFLDNLGIKLLAGKNLPAKGESADRFIVVNQAAAIELGYDDPSQIIGQVVEVDGSKEALEVIGLVEDFTFRLLLTQDKTGPLVLRNNPDSFKYANVKITSRDLKGTMAQLEEKWTKIDPIHPFRYEFFDEQLAATHQGIFDVVSVLAFLSFLAITIACLGMLGMATYTAERKRKEVGIRKVLGAEDVSIALLLSKDFLKILIISVLIGAPLSFILNNFWLENFPNRVEFGFGTVLLGSLVLLVLGLITIGSQTLRASKTRPVDSLRTD